MNVFKHSFGQSASQPDFIKLHVVNSLTFDNNLLCIISDTGWRHTCSTVHLKFYPTLHCTLHNCTVGTFLYIHKFDTHSVNQIVSHLLCSFQSDTGVDRPL